MIDNILTQSRLGRYLARSYMRVPLSGRLLSYIVRAEGGQLTSATLRTVLRDHFGVEAGAHSYGSLLVPGRADRGLTIGNYVSVGPDVRRFGAAHPLGHPSMHPYWYNRSLGLANDDEDVARTHCVIGHDAWIGAGAIILPGCTSIGIGAVVGAGSIVTKNVPDFAVVAGNPAKQIGERLSISLRARILEDEPWLMRPRSAKEYYRRLKEAA